MIAFIGLKIDQAKGLFFDRGKVVSAEDRATRRVLPRFGAFVRKTAKGSMRKAKKSADPGKPPKSHEGLLKKFLFFVYDRLRRSVIIGPALLNQLAGGGDQPVPELLEEGGTAERRLLFMWREADGRRRVSAAIRGQGDVVATGRGLRDRRTGRFVSKRKVEVIHSRSAPKQRVTYEPRPFMGPAFEKELPKVPQMWRDAIS